MKNIKINGKDLYIIDNLFSNSFHSMLYGYVSSMNTYGLGFADTDNIDNRNHVYYTAPFDLKELNDTNFFDEIEKTELNTLIGNKQLVRATVNSSVPSHSNFAHTHHSQWSMIYYLNLDWKPEWSGETLFYNEDLTEIEFASVYKPNRAIFFDGEIPHSLRTQSNIAPQYRFSLALFFER